MKLFCADVLLSFKCPQVKVFLRNESWYSTVLSPVQYTICTQRVNINIFIEQTTSLACWHLDRFQHFVSNEFKCPVSMTYAGKWSHVYESWVIAIRRWYSTGGSAGFANGCWIIYASIKRKKQRCSFFFGFPYYHGSIVFNELVRHKFDQNNLNVLLLNLTKFRPNLIDYYFIFWGMSIFWSPWPIQWLKHDVGEASG